MPQNFTPGTGRLATDRYDFKDHVEGTAQKHNADAITVSPAITVDGTPTSDVYSTLTELAALAGVVAGQSNVWETQATTGNLTILHTDTYTRINATLSTPITITLPATSLVTVGRYYIINDVSGNSQSNNITLTPNGANTINGAGGSKTLSSNRGTWIVSCNGTTSWQLSYSGVSGLTDTRLTYGSSYFEAASINFAGTSSLSASQLVVASAAVINSTQFTLNNVLIDGTGMISMGTTPSTVGTIRLPAGSTIYSKNGVSADMRLIGSSGHDVLVGDPVNTTEVQTHGELHVQAGIYLMDENDIHIDGGINRTVAVPIIPWGISSAVGSAAAVAASCTGITFIMDTGNRIYMSAVDVFFSAANTANTNQWGCIFDLTHYMHDTAELTSGILYVDPDAHGTLPQSMPSWGIFRRNMTNGSVDALLSGVSGLAVDTSANTTAYNAIHGITYTPNQNNEIDKFTYAYFGVLWDEGGTNAQTCQFLGIRLNFGSIGVMKWA